MRVFIIDDECDSRNIVKIFIADNFPDISVVGEAGNIEEALLFLRANHIDLLFLDIQLKEGTGFQILQALHKIDFDIIFITAYDQYAIEAIKNNALDYILKPVDRSEFSNAIKKSMAKKSAADTAKVDTLLKSFQKIISPPKVHLPTQHGFKIVSIEEIVRCEADGSYTQFHLNSGESILVSKTMKEYETKLKDNSFLRIHNSHMVNAYSIKEYIKGRGGEVVLTNGKRLPVSNGKKDSLLESLKLKK